MKVKPNHELTFVSLRLVPHLFRIMCKKSGLKEQKNACVFSAIVIQSILINVQTERAWTR